LKVELLHLRDVQAASKLIIELNKIQGKDKVKDDAESILVDLLIKCIDTPTFKFWIVKDSKGVVVGGAMCHFIYLPHLVKDRRLLVEGIYVKNENLNNPGKYSFAAIDKFCKENNIHYVIGECYDNLSRSNKYWKMLGAEAIGTLYRREV